MGKVVNYTDISNWEEYFDMTYDYLTFLLETNKITPELVIKTTRSILCNAGYVYELDEVRRRYYCS